MTAETVLNGLLARLLRDYGLEGARAEVTVASGVADIHLQLADKSVLIECKNHSNSAKKDAVSDVVKRFKADAQLRDGSIDAGIALVYAKDLDEVQFDLTSTISIGVVTKRDFLRVPPEELSDLLDWQLTNVVGLASTIEQLVHDIGDPDSLARELSSALDLAREQLSKEQKIQLAIRMGFAQDSQSLNEKDESWLNEASKRALLVVLSAAMFHSRLDQDQESIFPAGSKPKPLHDCITAHDLIGDLTTSWMQILDVNYGPIFETALAVLTSTTQNNRLSKAISIVVDAAQQISRDSASLRHDLLGRIFHKTLTEPEFDGSFYTTTPAAVLLAGLALQPWNLPDDSLETRIVDPACGTGTLLMAAVERLRELSDPNQFDYAQAIEQVVAGFDINLTAAHMAAVTLGLLSPSTSFKNMNIYLAAFGEDQDDASFVRAGSLELFAEGLQLPFVEFPSTRTQIETGETLQKIKRADLVIMNPPFTRDSLRHDQLPRSVELKVKQREKEIFKNFKGIVRFVSSGPAFIVLGEFLLKEHHGTLALVLPLVSLTNPSTHELRKWLAERFHVDVIVSSHDPKRFWFSENTSISETLVILRRRATTKSEPRDTRVINLAVNPQTVYNANHLLRNIDDQKFDHIHGTVVEWPHEKIKEGDWRAVQFLAPNLVRLSREIEDSQFFDVQSLEDIAEIYSTYRTARKHFKVVDYPDEKGRRALWHFKTDITATMQATTDVHIVTKEDENGAATVWDRRSHLLLPISLRTNLARVSAVYCDIPTVGSYWMNIRFNEDNDSMQKAVCVWLNSTLGFVSMLSLRTPHSICYPDFPLAWIKKLAIPSFTAKQKNELVRVFDQFAKTDLGRWSERENRHRVQFDAEIAEIVHLDRELVDGTRQSLAREPMCTNRQSINELIRSIRR